MVTKSTDHTAQGVKVNRNGNIITNVIIHTILEGASIEVHSIVGAVVLGAAVIKWYGQGSNQVRGQWIVKVR